MILPPELKSEFGGSRISEQKCCCCIKNSRDGTDITVGIRDFRSEDNLMYAASWVCGYLKMFCFF